MGGLTGRQSDPIPRLIYCDIKRTEPPLQYADVLSLASLAQRWGCRRIADTIIDGKQLSFWARTACHSTPARIIVIAQRLIRPAVVTIETPLIRVIIFSRSVLGRFASLSSLETLRDLVDHI